MLTRTDTWFCNTNNKITMQTVITPPTTTIWILASSVLSEPSWASIFSNPLLLAFKTFHERDTSCSAALLDIRITIFTPTMSTPDETIFKACCYFCRRHLLAPSLELVLPSSSQLSHWLCRGGWGFSKAHQHMFCPLDIQCLWSENDSASGQVIRISTVAGFVHEWSREECEYLIKHLVCSKLSELGSAGQLRVFSTLLHFTQQRV